MPSNIPHCETCTCEPPKPKKKKAGSTRVAGPFECKTGCGASPSLNHDTFVQHLKLVHTMSLAKYIAAYGIPQPMTEEEQENYVAHAECHLCDKVYSSDLGHRFPHSALGTHMRHHHGLKRDGLKWVPAHETAG